MRVEKHAGWFYAGNGQFFCNKAPANLARSKSSRPCKGGFKKYWFFDSTYCRHRWLLHGNTPFRSQHEPEIWTMQFIYDWQLCRFTESHHAKPAAKQSNLIVDHPTMPSIQEMRQMSASSGVSQAKFFLLMLELQNIHLKGLGSFFYRQKTLSNKMFVLAGRWCSVLIATESSRTVVSLLDSIWSTSTRICTCA